MAKPVTEIDHDIEDTEDLDDARPWLTALTEATKYFESYQDRADNIDKLFGELSELTLKSGDDREFQMFWANVSVLGPSVYSRPPVPVVVPRFQDRRPISTQTSELLERALNVQFDLAGLDDTMRLVRDDMNIVGRGPVWLRYEEADDDDDEATETVCIEHADRKDFLHEPARKWAEVGWVAKRSWLSRAEVRERFPGHENDVEYQDKADKSLVKQSTVRKAGIWEIWSKTKKRVFWVAESHGRVLDQDVPHLKLKGFYPCPKPAYATLQRRTTVPIPDVMYYRGQLEEINALTKRIGALTHALKVRGFYPAGAGEIGDAVEAAMKMADDRATLIGVANWNMMAGVDPNSVIVWLPLDVIVAAITQCVSLRQQLIQDVYQITGISDIMRGSTAPTETLGAQQLKSQYGSIRVRDRQDELTRIARDITMIAGEIMAAKFDKKTFLSMSQLQIPTDADIAKQVAGINKQASQLEASVNQQIQTAKTNPQLQQQAQQNPQAAQQLLQQANAHIQQAKQQAQQQIAALQQQPTLEKCVKLLRDKKMMPFVLDIETDSTIAPDENSQKQAAAEFMQSFTQFLQLVGPMVAQYPQAAPLASEALKYVVGQFRAGRPLQGAIDEFADNMKNMASQPPKPDPTHDKVQAEMQVLQAKAQAEGQAHQANMQAKQQDAQIKVQMAQHEVGLKQQHANLSMQATQQQAQLEAQKTMLEIELLKAKIDQARNGGTPSESIAFKDLPPEGQAQMAAQAGINLSPDQIVAHKAAQQAAEAAQQQASLANIGAQP